MSEALHSRPNETRTLLDDPMDFATAWIAAWNARDVEADLAYYADDVVFTSPTALGVVPESNGTIHGKGELRRYWNLAPGGNPGLHFELVAVYAGVDTIALHYRNQIGSLVVEVLTFEVGVVSVGHATHRVPITV